METLCWCCLSPAWDSSDQSDQTLGRKLTVGGDCACGKTSLLLRISRDEFPSDGSPPVFDTDVIEVFRGNYKVRLTLQDSPGQEIFDRRRQMGYTDVDVILLCFSLDSPDTLRHVESIWIQEVRYYCPETPIILVGNKKDLRDQWEKTSPGSRPKGQEVVTSTEGMEAARRIGATDYVECSAKTGDGTKMVLGAAVRSITL